MSDSYETLRRRSETPSPQSRVDAVQDRIWTDILRRAKRRRRRQQALLAAFGIVAVALVAYGGLALQRFLATEDSILVIDSPTVVTTVSSTTSTTTALYLDEAAVQGARETVNRYFIAVRTGAFEDFEHLIASSAAGRAEALFNEERTRLEASGEEVLAVLSMKPLVWMGDSYLVEPGVDVPVDLDAWIREDPCRRAAMETTMMDESLRYVRVQRESPGSEWVVVP